MIKRFLIATLFVPALCVAQPIRTGESALGDWRSDVPGLTRHITQADLPQPAATPSSSRGPRVTQRPAGALPTVPAGFSVGVWATGLDMPRILRTAPNGDVFLAESGAGRIRVWRPQAGSGLAGPGATFAKNLNQPFGIVFWPPAQPRYVYVAETNRVVRYPYGGGSEPTGPAEVVIPSLPEGGHWTRDLAASPDGSILYVSVGSSSNVARGMQTTTVPGATAAAAGVASGEETGRAAVFRFAPAGGPLELVASGIRNCVGLAIEPKTKALWCATNERDGMGDNLPPDYASRITPGAFYGWPWFYIGDHEDPRHRGERLDLAGRVTTPDVLFQPHSAPLGITFYDGQSFPPDFRGDGLVALHGSWNRSRRTGYKVVRILLHDGVPTGAYQDFMTGFVANDDSVWGRPVGLTVLRDGSLLVSEDGNGTIWRVSH